MVNSIKKNIINKIFEIKNIIYNKFFNFFIFNNSNPKKFIFIK